MFPRLTRCHGLVSTTSSLSQSSHVSVFADMKKSTFLKPIRLLVLFALCFGHANAAPYGPNGREVRWVQPNGKVLNLRVFGDDYYARTETTEGYTVVYKGGENAYYYARLAKDSSSMVPTDTRADRPAPAGLKKGLDLPMAKAREVVAANRAKFFGERNNRWNQRVQSARKAREAGPEAAIQAVPVNGEKRGLTIIAQFPNDPQTAGVDPVDFPTNRSKIVSFCNDVGYNQDGNTGSVRDYFFDQSGGQVTYTQTVTSVVTLPRPRAYYNYSDYPSNQTVRPDAGVTGRLLLTDAINVLISQGFDFSGLTTDENGRAIATNVFFAGQDSGVFAAGLWPHQWNLATGIDVGTPGNPIIIYNYQITNIEDSRPVIGTFCHENGHLLLDLPDIYSFFGEGVGEHCLMGSGNYLNDGKTPSPINAYFKDIVGWATTTDLAPGDFTTTNLRTTGNGAFRIRNPGLSTESFFFENRGSGDKWAKFSRDKGIAVWHIDETISGNNDFTAPHYGVALIQADARADLENGRNRGDTQDLFDLDTPILNDTTAPNVRWWDGNRSAVRMEVLSAVGPSTRVTFGTLPPDSIIVDSPNGGDVIFPASKFTITWRSSITGNVKIDLLKGGVFKSEIAGNQADDGSYTWKVPGSLTAATDYTIRISSLTNLVPTSDLSDAPFTINDFTFPANDVIPHGWFKPSGVATIWKLSKAVPYEGAFGFASGQTGDGKSSGVAYQSNFKAGTVSFYMKVSSEKGYDVGRFYIDGERQVFKNYDFTNGLSGDTKWVFASFPVSAGNHTLKWTYEKDDSYADLRDELWLDGVTLPETTQEMAVDNSAGVNLVDGETTSNFPDRFIASPSKPRTFTIRNSGKADLTDLTVTMDGAHPADFTVTAPKKKVLRKGESTTFQITFKPTKRGLRKAGVRVASNDEDEGNFLINVQGTGLGVPSILVSRPPDEPLADAGKAVDFGVATVNTQGRTRTFTITNSGNGPLENISMEKTGANKENFILTLPGVSTLEPKASTTFKVTFKPSARDLRTATIRVFSSDKEVGPFDIKVTGKGAPRNKAASAPRGSLAAALSAPSAGRPGGTAPTTQVEVIDGKKYLSLTVTKQSMIYLPGSVEVSPNLLDWYSGNAHTTIVIDNPTTLKVRDSTPVTPDNKRYIRLK